MLHLLTPIIMTTLYTNISKNELQKIDKNYVHIFSIFHNLFLQLFSFYTFVKLSLVLWKYNISANRQFYFQIKEVDNILFLFYISKYYEFIDTFILYAKKKEPILLQKYHHIGATFMWHLGYIYKFDGLFFASLLNSFVHTVMYLYYLCSLFPTLSNKIRKYKIYITFAQIGQLVYGGFALPWYYYSLETQENKNVILIFDAYIGVLICLFIHFMMQTYFSSTKKIKTI